jgi:hypothetical protein
VLLAQYCSDDNIEKNEIGGACSTYGVSGEVHIGFWWGNLRERPIARPRRRWEDNIKMDLKEVGWGTYWINLAQYMVRWWALVNVVMNLWVP